MPRQLHLELPQVINKVSTKNSNGKSKYIEFASGNLNKIKEIQRNLPDFEVIGKSLDIEEIQSLDPIKVATIKAKMAYEANGYNPILVEDTSMDIKGLENLPGTYLNDFFSNPASRWKIASEWLEGRDRSATARVIFAIYDGEQAYTFEGICEGEISEKPKGGDGFGWDDIFIPNGQPKGEKKTFAQMSAKGKDRYSMRVKALKKLMKELPELTHIVFKLPEPYDQELRRPNISKLKDPKAIDFAFKLESIEGINKPNEKFVADRYKEVVKLENPFYTRYLTDKESKSLGLMLTDVDRGHLKLNRNGSPVMWQIGPERRHLALLQRAEYFLEHQNEEIHKILDGIEKNIENFPKRNNRRSLAIERAMEVEGFNTFTKAVALKEIGYKKLKSDKLVSRTKASRSGLFTVIGKYARSIYSLGSMPAISGQRDMIVMSVLGHMPVFVHRNSINAVDIKNQIDVINAAKKVISSLNLGKKATARAFNNIGAALGTNPKKDLEKAILLNKKAGVKLFRIYTINSDPRIVQTAKALRDHFGDSVEIFVGQIVDLELAKRLIEKDIRADGLIYGHGGGRQCTSATNGMALSTLEEVYQVLIEKEFNNTTIMVEGGIGTSVGSLLVMGIDGILRNAQFANGVIEQSDIFFEHKSGKICQPYHGSASAATMIIESFNPANAKSRLSYSGRTRNVEGKPGYIFYEEKANSMSFYVDQFKHYAARTLADLGVESISELREFLNTNNIELLRHVSPEAQHISGAWKS